MVSYDSKITTLFVIVFFILFLKNKYIKMPFEQKMIYKGTLVFPTSNTQLNYWDALEIKKFSFDEGLFMLF